jgi:hypothetical protein
MSDLTYRAYPTVTRDRTATLFGQTMGYVAITAGLFALGAYLGRHLSEGWALVWYIVAFACLIAMNFTARRAKSGTGSVVLLLAFGVALGLATWPLSPSSCSASCSYSCTSRMPTCCTRCLAWSSSPA